MRAYLVSAQPQGSIVKFTIASTQADAKEKRDALMDELGVKKKDCNIEEIEIPNSKQELLEFINEQISDAYECGANAPRDENEDDNDNE